MPSSAIRIISFDATGILFRPHPSIGAIYAKVLADFDIDLPERELDRRFATEFHKARSHPLAHVTEEAELNRWKQIVRGILQQHYSETIFRALALAFASGQHWRRVPQVRTVLRQLGQDGYRLIVVSNWDCRIYTILQDLKLMTYFRDIFISSQIGVEKPSPEVFRLVARRLATPPQALLHVGDSREEDLEAAARAGWKSLLINREIPPGVDPKSVLPSIAALPRFLEERGKRKEVRGKRKEVRGKR